MSKQKPGRRVSLAYKLNILTIIMILLVSGGLLTITYQVHSRKLDSIYFGHAETAALLARESILPETVQ